MKILVTGSGGMLGKEFLNKLASVKGNELIGIDRKICDLTDKGATKVTLEKNSPDLVIHCAAKVGGIQANIKNPVEFLSTNLLIDSSVLLGSLESGVENLIYIGSSCMYPRNFRQPLLESDILSGELEPTNEGYAIAKIAGSRLASYISEEFDLNYKTLIPSNLYGPGDNFSPESSHLVAASLLKAHNAKEAGVRYLDVWGDGTARREFTYIGDLSDWLTEHINEIDRFPDILNVGAGTDYSIDEFYEYALEVVGHEAQLKHDDTKPAGMSQKLMDSTLAKSKFGWNPTTNLKSGMKVAYRDFLEGKSRS